MPSIKFKVLLTLMVCSIKEIIKSELLNLRIIFHQTCWTTTLFYFKCIFLYKFIEFGYHWIFIFCSDFDIVYRLAQQSSSRPEIFLTLTSDWDLDAAFHTASYPFLQLQVQPFRREGIVYNHIWLLLVQAHWLGFSGRKRIVLIIIIG